MKRACAALIAVIALAATRAPAAVSVTDDEGATVAIDVPATRIVSLAPHATELLYAAGAGQRIVGVLAGSDFPPDAASKPKVGDAHLLDMERIIALAPDLVVTWAYSAPAQVASLRSRGVPVFITNPTSIEGIAADIERLGALAATLPIATERAQEFRTRRAQLAARGRGGPSIRVFYQVWNEPLYTIGGRHLISEALGVCGGENVFASLSLPAPQVSIEAVLAARPDAIIAGADRGIRPGWLDEWRRWAALPAVAKRNLYTVDANLLHRPGPRFLDGVAQLCDVLDKARAPQR
jgi:iron complex transport system substrate-binding protein